MPKLYILCGPSGCGKSTWAHTNMQDTMYVSRDEIRFRLVGEDEGYFSREKEVFKEFVKEIVSRLKIGADTIADATHLNEFSRRKLTQAIDMYMKDYQIIYVTFNIDIDTCLIRNTKREGRANVPENIIRNMYRDFRAPTKDEDERVIDIIEVGE